jgi:hypothetical protein
MSDINSFFCPYLQGQVELSEDRELHITQRHPDFLPNYKNKIADVLSGPDQVRKSKRFGNARLFTRWFEDVRAGKFVVIVVVTDGSAPHPRHWVITAYIARKITEGEIEWKRS